MINTGIFDAVSRFESQMLSYMQDIGFGIFCFVLLLFSLAYVFFNIGIVHASPKFESQKTIYKQDTGFEIF